MKKYNYVRKTFSWEGKRYTAYGKTEMEALQKMVELKEALKRGEKAINDKTTVDRWFREWIEVYKKPSGITEKSLDMYMQKYNGYIKPVLGSLPLKDIKEIQLQKILNEEAGKSYSHVSKLRMVITEEERQHIQATAQIHRAGLWVLTILYTGLRPGETATLLWKDIDFDKDEIHVYKALESGTGAIKGPKTQAGNRDIPIHSALRGKLLAARGDPFAYVFTKVNGKPLTADAMQQLWKSFVRAMNLEMGATVYRNKIVQPLVADDLTPYCLRHTFCTDLQRAGVPINVAKELMGHSNIAVTANIYTHRDGKTLHHNIQKLSDWEASQCDKTSGKKEKKMI